MVYRDKFIMDDALPIRNLTIATIGMGEQLRAAVSFSEPDMPVKWRQFMEMLSMLYGVTKWFLYDQKAKARLDEFMAAWFKYGFAVKRYHELAEAVAQKTMTEDAARPVLDEAKALFETVNPSSSLEMLDILILELKKKGIFSIKESTTVDEGFEEPAAAEEPEAK